MGIRLYLPGVRISYPHLFVPHVAKGATEAKYGAAIILPNNAPAVPENQLAGATLLEQVFNARARIIAEFMKGVAPVPGKDLPAYPGPTREPNNPDFANVYILGCNNKSKPTVVDGNMQPVMNTDLIYPGCYVNASISIYYYEKLKGIAIGLDGVQFLRDGPRLDNKPTAGDMFKPIVGAPPAMAGMPAQYQAPQQQQQPVTAAPGQPFNFLS
jgi:hypothetical protein